MVDGYVFWKIVTRIVTYQDLHVFPLCEFLQIFKNFLIEVVNYQILYQIASLSPLIPYKIKPYKKINFKLW
jgi:hypothetical protein